MRQKLIVIYGLPRTGTTFLFDRFVASGAYGTRAGDVTGRMKKFVTEEPAAISRISFTRQEPGYRSKRYIKKLWKALDRFFSQNQTDLPIVTKNPSYTFVGDLLHEYFVAHDIDAVWINTRRNLLDIAASSDNQGELFHDLYHNTRGYSDDEYRSLFASMFFMAPRWLRFASPEYLAVTMLKNMQHHESLVTSTVDPFVFDYDSIPTDIDAQIETLTGINPGILENWRHGSGRNHVTQLNLNKVQAWLEELSWKQQDM